MDQLSDDVTLAFAAVAALLIGALAVSCTCIAYWQLVALATNAKNRFYIYKPGVVIASFFSGLAGIIPGLLAAFAALSNVTQRAVATAAQRPIFYISLVVIFLAAAVFPLILGGVLNFINGFLLVFRGLWVGLLSVASLAGFLFEIIIVPVNYGAVRLPAESVTGLLFDTTTCSSEALIVLTNGTLNTVLGLEECYSDWVDLPFADQWNSNPDCARSAAGVAEIIETLPTFTSCICGTLGYITDPFFEALTMPPPARPTEAAGFITALNYTLTSPVWIARTFAVPFLRVARTADDFAVGFPALYMLLRGAAGIPGNAIESYLVSYVGAPLDAVTSAERDKGIFDPLYHDRTSGALARSLPPRSWHYGAQQIPFPAPKQPRLASEPPRCDTFEFFECVDTCFNLTQTVCDMTNGCYFDTMGMSCERCSTCTPTTLVPPLNVDTSAFVDYVLLGRPTISLFTEAFSMNPYIFVKNLGSHPLIFQSLGRSVVGAEIVVKIVSGVIDSATRLIVDQEEGVLFSFEGQGLFSVRRAVEIITRFMCAVRDFFASIGDFFGFLGDVLAGGTGDGTQCANIRFGQPLLAGCIFEIVGTWLRELPNVLKQLVLAFLLPVVATIENAFGIVFTISVAYSNEPVCVPGDPLNSMYCQIDEPQQFFAYSRWYRGVRRRLSTADPVYCPLSVCDLPECTMDEDCAPYERANVAGRCEMQYNRCVFTGAECSQVGFGGGVTGRAELSLLPQGCVDSVGTSQGMSLCALGNCLDNLNGPDDPGCDSSLSDMFFCDCECGTNQFRTSFQPLTLGFNSLGAVVGRTVYFLPFPFECLSQWFGGVLEEGFLIIIDVLANVVQIAEDGYAPNAKPLLQRGGQFVYCFEELFDPDLVPPRLSANDDGPNAIPPPPPVNTERRDLAGQVDCLRKAFLLIGEGLGRSIVVFFRQGASVPNQNAEYLASVAAVVTGIFRIFGALINLLGIAIGSFAGSLAQAAVISAGNFLKDNSVDIGEGFVDVLSLFFTCVFGFFNFFFRFFAGDPVGALESLGLCALEIFELLIQPLIEPVTCVINAVSCAFTNQIAIPGDPTCVLSPGSGQTDCTFISLCNIFRETCGIFFLELLNEIGVSILGCLTCNQIEASRCSDSDAKCLQFLVGDVGDGFGCDTLEDPNDNFQQGSDFEGCFDGFFFPDGDDDDSTFENTVFDCCYEDNVFRDNRNGCADRRFGSQFLDVNNCELSFYVGGTCYTQIGGIVDGFIDLVEASTNFTVALPDIPFFDDYRQSCRDNFNVNDRTFSFTTGLTRNQRAQQLFSFVQSAATNPSVGSRILLVTNTGLVFLGTGESAALVENANSPSGYIALLPQFASETELKQTLAEKMEDHFARVEIARRTSVLSDDVSVLQDSRFVQYASIVRNEQAAQSRRSRGIARAIRIILKQPFVSVYDVLNSSNVAEASAHCRATVADHISGSVEWPPVKSVLAMARGGAGAVAHEVARCVDSLTLHMMLPDFPLARAVAAWAFPLMAYTPQRMHRAEANVDLLSRLHPTVSLAHVRALHDVGRKEVRVPELATAALWVEETDGVTQLFADLFAATKHNYLHRSPDHPSRRRVQRIVSLARKMSTVLQGITETGFLTQVSDTLSSGLHRGALTMTERAGQLAAEVKRTRATLFPSLSSEQRGTIVSGRNSIVHAIAGRWADIASNGFGAGATRRLERIALDVGRRVEAMGYRVSSPYYDRLGKTRQSLIDQRMAAGALVASQSRRGLPGQANGTSSVYEVDTLIANNDMLSPLLVFGDPDTCRTGDSPFMCCDDQDVCLDCSYVDRITYGIQQTVELAGNYYRGDFLRRFARCRVKALETFFFAAADPEFACPSQFCNLPPCSQDSHCRESFMSSTARCVPAIERCVNLEADGLTCILGEPCLSALPPAVTVFDENLTTVLYSEPGFMSGPIDIGCQCDEQYLKPTKRVPFILDRLFHLQTPFSLNFSVFVERVFGAGRSESDTLLGDVPANASGAFLDVYQCDQRSVSVTCDALAAVDEETSSFILAGVDNTTYRVNNLNAAGSSDAFTRFLEAYILCDYNSSWYCPLSGDVDESCCSDTCEQPKRQGLGLFNALISTFFVPLLLAFILRNLCCGISVDQPVWVVVTALYLPLLLSLAYGGQLLCYIGSSFVIAAAFFSNLTRIANVIFRLFARCCSCSCAFYSEVLSVPPFLVRIFRFVIAVFAFLSLFFQLIGGLPVCFAFDVFSLLNGVISPCGITVPALVNRSSTDVTATCFSLQTVSYVQCINNPDLAPTQFNDGIDSALYYCETFFPGCAESVSDFLLDNEGGGGGFLGFIGERALIHTTEAHSVAPATSAACAFVLSVQAFPIVVLSSVVAALVAVFLKDILLALGLLFASVFGVLGPVVPAFTQASKMLFLQTLSDAQEEAAKES